MLLSLLTLIISCGDEGGSGNDVGRPEINGVTPDSGFVGDAVTITAGGLVPQPEDNIVRFNGTKATVKSVSAGRLVTAVPGGATSGVLTLEVAGGIAKGPFFTVLIPTPTITSVVPTSARPGERITITGTNFGGSAPPAATNSTSGAFLGDPQTLARQAEADTTQKAPVITENDITVTVGGVTAKIISVTDTQIIIEVPPGATDGAIVVTVNGQSDSTDNRGITINVLTPEITGIAPTSGMPGTKVTITGTDFDIGNTVAVTFNGTAAMVTSSSATEITTAVPAGATNGPVAVTTDGQTATGPAFTVDENQIFAGGDGSEIDPYQVASLAQLQAVGQFLSSNFVQTADIDASATATMNDGAGFAPIGNNANPFTGAYDGGNFTISGLTTDRADTDLVGLFGVVRSDGVLTNVGLIGVNITGNQGVGGLVGFNNGTITDAYATGTVSGTNATGGLVGVNDGGIITDSYATGTVSGTTATGGLVGGNDGNGAITTSYATGTVSGSDNTGGLVGNSISSTVTNSYWDTEATGQTTSEGGTGLTTAQMVGPAAQDNMAGLNFKETWKTNTTYYPTLPANPQPDLPVIEINEAPTITSEATFEVAENTTTVGTIAASDPNGDDLSFSITGGSDAGRFAIISSTGALRFTAAPDFEAPADADTDNEYLVTVQVSDGQESVTQDLTVTVTNVEENTSPFAGGDGTEGDPYEVENLAQLQAVGQFLSSNFIQTANIDASATQGSGYGDGGGFTPIGNQESVFTGNYDGGAFTISGLTINRPNTNYIGLFGVVKSTGTITNVGLIGVKISGKSDIGGLIGQNNGGTISGSYATGTVKGGAEGYVGGLIGYNSSSITNSYANVSVSGSGSIGGLVGFNFGTITDTYANSAVSGSGLIGGLIGQNYSGGTITNSYWNTEATGQVTSSGGGTGLTTAQMVGSTAADNMTGFNFTDTWTTNPTFYPTLRANPQPNLPVIEINEAPSITSAASFDVAENATAVDTVTATDPNEDELTFSLSGGVDEDLFSIDGSSGALSFISAPDFEAPGDANTDNEYLVTVQVSDGTENVSQALTITVTDVDENPFAGGDGSEANPYQVATLAQLQDVGNFLSSHFKQTANIDASATQGSGYGDGGGFAPIGSNTNQFTGRYDGGEFTISGLAINRTRTSVIGLFGAVGSGGALTNVRLTGADMTGNSQIGGLTGFNFGTISGSSVSGNVSGSFNIGGLMGFNGGTITDSYATGVVKGGSNRTGGLVGENRGTITDTYATSTVSGGPDTGGLVGDNQGTITAAYAAGAVSGSNNTGGLVGFNNGGTVTTSYWDTQATGQATSGGGTPLMTSQMLGNAATDNMSGFDFTNTWRTNTSFYPTLGDNPQPDLPTVNQSPSITSDASFEVAENTTAVGTITATDPDGDDNALTFSLSGGDDEGAFTINKSGELSFDPAPDFENPGDVNSDNAYQVSVQVSDGTNNVTQDLTVTVTNANDNAPAITSEPVFEVDENTTAVGTITASDADGSVLTFSINGGDDAGLFSINDTNGELSFDSEPDFENPADTGSDNDYQVTVQVSDGNVTASQPLTISVTNVNEAPSITSASEFSVAENTTAVGEITASDPENDALTFSLSGGDDAGDFSIGETNGALSFNSEPDFEAPGDANSDNDYQVTVQVSDGTNSVTQALTVSVTNANDNAPTITSEADITATEGQTAATTVTATDADGSTLTFSISGGDDAGDFSIGGSSGALSFNSAPDPDNPDDANGDNEYLVTVQVSDGNATDSQMLTITVPVFAGGDGSAGNPFEVANLGQLQRVGNNLSANFVQIANINASATANASYGDGNGFAPIGNGSSAFNGSYNGDGFTVSGLTINRPTTDFVGLFGNVDTGTISNVTITAADVTGREFVGGLAGNNFGTITASSASGTVSGTNITGGLVGTSSFSSTISNSSAAVTVSVSDGGINAGGLVGENSGAITGSSATGSVSGTNFTGGLTGNNFGGTITDSYATGTVSGDVKTGGLTGENSGDITGSFATGNVSGTDGTGGLVGNNLGIIADSYASGTVSGVNATAGLVGVNENTINRSYATGSVNGSGSDTGGLVGLNNDTVTNSYWDTATTGQATSAGGTGLTTADMQGAAAETNMAGFDFTNVWMTQTGPDGYPILQEVGGQ